MRKVFILKYLVMLAVVSLIAACSQIPLQSKRDSFETQSVPDSSKDYSDEMSFIEDWEYETSVRYNDLEFKKAFDAAQLSVKKAGYRVVFADKDSGRIDGERVLGTDPKDIYPLQVMIEKREMSLVVYLRAKAVRGTIDSSNLCTFYAEFDGLITAAPALRKPEPAPVMPKNVQQAEITPTPPPVSASKQSVVLPSPPPLPSSPQPPPTVPRLTQVIWSTVNLREGPGKNYKIIGNAKKGASLSILEEEEGWLRVRLANGKEVWVSKSATSEWTKQTPSASVSSSPSPSAVSSPSTSASSTPPTVKKPTSSKARSPM